MRHSDKEGPMHPKAAFYRRPIAWPLMLLGAYLLSAVLGVYGFILAGADVGQANTWTTVFMNIFVGSLCAVSLNRIHGQRFMTCRRDDNADNRPFSGRKGYVIIFALFILVWLTALISPIAYKSLTSEAGAAPMHFNECRNIISYVALSVILAPVAEELLFRGILYGRFASTRMSPAFAAIITSAVFGLLHGGDPSRFMGTFILGMFLCLVYEKKGGLLACMVFHSFNNLSSIPLSEQQIPILLTNAALGIALWAMTLIIILYLLAHNGTGSTFRASKPLKTRGLETSEAEKEKGKSE